MNQDGLSAQELAEATEAIQHEVLWKWKCPGLVTSTVLNLFIVPSLYLRFGRKKDLLFRHSAG